MKSTELYDLKDILNSRLNEKVPRFMNGWNEVICDLGTDLVGHLKEILEPSIFNLHEIHKFKFTVVLDNNFVLGQIMGFVDNGKRFEDSFIFRLINATYINVCGPHKLAEELRAKIDVHIKTDKGKAHFYADAILEKINIQDAQWVEDWKKAQNLIGHIDSDDVPYLALSFHAKSHAIISHDKVFENQTDTRVWKMSDAGRVITTYNSGFISFCILGGVKEIIANTFKLIIALIKHISDFAVNVITWFGQELKRTAISLYDDIPEELKLFVAILIALGIIVSEKVKEFASDMIKKAADFVKMLLHKAKEFIDLILKAIGELYVRFEPIGITSLEILGYFLVEWRIMKEEVVLLEQGRSGINQLIKKEAGNVSTI